MPPFTPSNELISLFASSHPHQFECREYRDLEAMTISSYWSFRPDASRSSSFGLLGLLPTELLIQITDLLDLRSLGRLSYASVKAYSIIHALPAYQALTRYAPEIIYAFSKMRISHWHTLYTVYQALRSDRCIWCKHFGGYLFLPTCERACRRCLVTKFYFRMLPISAARRFFQVTMSEWFRLPQLTRFFDTQPTDEVGRVSTIHLLHLWNQKHPDELLEWETLGEWMGLEMSDSYENHMHTDVENKAIGIPFLSDGGEVEPGFECRKCREVNTPKAFDWNLTHLYTRAELWEHCKICSGQPRLLEILERESMESEER